MKRLTALVAVVLLTSCSTGWTASGDISCLTSGGRDCRDADLSGVDLSGVDLSGFVFRGADLSGADLSGADLSGADLTSAILEDVDATAAEFVGADLYAVKAINASLGGANLSGADLSVADLRSAGLRSAVLVGADLRETNLHGADLNGADLSETLLLRTQFGDADVRDVTALNAILSDTYLSGAFLEGSTWRGSVVRAEYLGDVDDDVFVKTGALVCGFESCNGAPTPVSDGDVVDVPMTALTMSLLNISRAGLTNLETPNVLSRAASVSFLAAAGVYPDHDLGPVLEWSPVDTSLPSGLRDAGALYALGNTTVGVRWNKTGVDRNGRMRIYAATRDVTLWEITRTSPHSRSAIAAGGVSASNAALLRATSDGYDERATTFEPAGTWQPTPPGFAPGVEPGWGDLLTYHPTARECRAGEPVHDPKEQAEEVRRIATNLTDDQQESARFWDDERLRTSTPVGHWQNIATKVLDGRSDVSVRERILLLADLHMGIADTLIMVWHEKYEYQTARPLTVLQDVEPGWNSYLTNPPFPAYPSGHAAVSAFSSRHLANRLGEGPFTDNGAFENESGMRALNVSPRSFRSLEQAGEEAGLSRIWGGIHVMDDYDGGRRIGHCVAGLR